MIQRFSGEEAMAGAINEYAFNLPDALLRARGCQPGHPLVFPDGSEDWQINGGMWAPTEIGLLRDSRIVRFSGASERRDRKTGKISYGGSPLPELAAAGGWWLAFEEYKIVEAYANAGGTSISRAIRTLCCVPIEWNDATLVLQARLLQPLLAYTGWGRTAEGEGETLNGHNPHGRRVRQLFIPGLGSADVRRSALAIEGYGFLPHG